MKRALLLLFLASGVASAQQSISEMSELFPAQPCHDGWAGCIVDGKEVTAEPVRDGVGRPLPANMRVGWFDLEATTAFNPFVELSAYTGELPSAAPAPAVAGIEDDAMAALLDGDIPQDDEPPAPTTDERDPDPVPDRGDPDERDRPSAVVGSADLSTDPEPRVEPDRFVEPDPDPVVVAPEPEPDPVVVEPEPDPDPIIEPDPEPDVASLEPAVLEGQVTCDNLVALEPTALMGKLNVGQLECLEGRIATSPTMTDKDKTSRVLLANAEAKGDKREWERLMRRHLEEIDRSDPNLCFKYALHLSRGGVGRAWGVIKWADYALENKNQWSGATYKSRVYSLYQLKAEAANKLWEDSNAKLVNAQGGEREELASKEEKARGMAKDYAMEWLDYARASNQDTTKPMQLCVAAAGSKKYCQE